MKLRLPKFLRRTPRVDFKVIRVQHRVTPMILLNMSDAQLEQHVNHHYAQMKAAVAEALTKSEFMTCSRSQDFKGLLLEVHLRLAPLQKPDEKQQEKKP